MVGNYTMARLIHQMVNEEQYQDKTFPDVYVIRDNISESEPPLYAVKSNGCTYDVCSNNQDLLIDDYEVIVSRLLQKAVGKRNIIGAAATNDENEHTWEIRNI